MSHKTVHVPRIDPTIEAILADPEGYYRNQRKATRWSDLHADVRWMLRSLIKR